MVKKNKGLCTKILADVDLERMAILVCHEEQIVAEITYEKGIDNIEIEIVPSQDGLPKQIFFLNDFLKIIEEGRLLAIECAKADEERNNDNSQF